MNQYIELETSNIFLGIEHKIDMALIKEGCRIFNIPYIGGGIFFVPQEKLSSIIVSTIDLQIKNISNTKDEIDAFKQQIEKQLYGRDHLIIYTRLNKYHPRYVYYNAVAIASSNVNDFKKVMRIHKMKAFL